MPNPQSQEGTVPEAVIDLAMSGHPESWRETIVPAVERAWGYFRAEQADRLKEVERQRDEAREERDFAVAHDRQPYPTADAYEKVCAARTKWQERAEKAEAALAERDQQVREEIERELETLESQAAEADREADREKQTLVGVVAAEASAHALKATYRRLEGALERLVGTQPSSTPLQQEPEVGEDESIAGKLEKVARLIKEVTEGPDPHTGDLLRFLGDLSKYHEEFEDVQLQTVAWYNGLCWLTVKVPKGIVRLVPESTPELLGEADEETIRHWEQEEDEIDRAQPEFKELGTSGHRVVLTFDGGGPSLKLLHPEGGCVPATQCALCGRVEESESEPCYDCKDGFDPSCWLTDWFNNHDADELLHGSVTVPFTTEWDQHHLKIVIDGPSPASLTQPVPGNSGTETDRERADRLEVECRELEDANRSLAKMRDRALEGNLAVAEESESGNSGGVEEKCSCDYDGVHLCHSLSPERCQKAQGAVDLIAEHLLLARDGTPWADAPTPRRKVYRAKARVLLGELDGNALCPNCRNCSVGGGCPGREGD